MVSNCIILPPNCLTCLESATILRLSHKTAKLCFAVLYSCQPGSALESLPSYYFAVLWSISFLILMTKVSNPKWISDTSTKFSYWLTKTTRLECYLYLLKGILAIRDLSMMWKAVRIRTAIYTVAFTPSD